MQRREASATFLFKPLWWYSIALRVKFESQVLHHLPLPNFSPLYSSRFRHLGLLRVLNPTLISTPSLCSCYSFPENILSTDLQMIDNLLLRVSDFQKSSSFINSKLQHQPNTAFHPTPCAKQILSHEAMLFKIRITILILSSVLEFICFLLLLNINMRVGTVHGLFTM